MDKIPVEQTISQTYQFAFGRYFRLLGITWLPLLIMTVAGYFLFRNLMPDYVSMVQHLPAAPGTPPVNPFAAYSAMRWIWPYDLLVMLLFVMITAGITKEALGVRTGSPFVYLSFGKAELGLAVAYVLVFAIFFVVMLAVILITVIAGVILAAGGHSNPNSLQPATVGLMIPLILLLYLFALFFVLRLAFFIAPVIVAEGGIGIGRSWQLGKGNFWRIIVIALAIWIPLLVAEMIVMSVMIFPSIGAAMMKAHGNPQVFVPEMMKAYFDMMPYVMAVFFFVAPVVYGLITAPSAFAYRALVPEKPAEPAA